MSKPSKLILTTTAAGYAERSGLSSAISSLSLPESTAVGDIVSVKVADKSHNFAVIRRRWIAAGANPSLEITLDYPASGGR